ncbi:MAG: thermonuclease family protein [Kiritimatiellae bacterium]|nr:thermonuclease family protein [Kiritimatiellia bacterium]
MMRLILSAVALVAAFAASGKTLEGEVTRVSDGDTIWVKGSGEQGKGVKVRLDRIDAPESKQDYGFEAKEYLNGRIGGKTVKVEWQKKDPYGRILGIVYLDGVDINLEMVATGNAWHYAYFDNTPEYTEAEKSARAARLGLWSGDSPINPYDFRQARKREVPESFSVGDIIAVKFVDGKPVVFDPATDKPIPLLPADK